jgi:nucleotide-binding universal stress UspA family protein
MVYVQKKSSDYNSPGYFEEEHRWAEAKFKALVAKYSDYLQNDSKLRYIIKSGKIYREVVSQVESYKESMVVASTHGASGFEEFFLGSNAFKIIEATTRPVMIIRKNRIPEDIHKIVLPIDVMADTRQKVPYTVELAQLFGAEVHVITITTSKSKKIINRLAAYSRQVTNYLDAKKVPYKAKSLFGEALVDLIVVYADSSEADLISIMKEQTKTMNIIDSLTHQILNRATIPVLCVTARETHIATGFRTFGG